MADGTRESYGYRPDGLRASVTDVRGESRFDYDAALRVARMTGPDGAYVRYVHDAAGLRTRVAHGDGTTAERVLDYAYDALGRIVRMSASDGGVTVQSFDPAGNVVRVEYANGMTKTMTYDLRDRLRTLVHRAADGTVVEQETYSRNAHGDVTRIDRGDGSRIDYRVRRAASRGRRSALRLRAVRWSAGPCSLTTPPATGRWPVPPMRRRRLHTTSPTA